MMRREKTRNQGKEMKKKHKTRKRRTRHVRYDMIRTTYDDSERNKETNTKTKRGPASTIFHRHNHGGDNSLGNSSGTPRKTEQQVLKSDSWLTVGEEKVVIPRSDCVVAEKNRDHHNQKTNKPTNEQKTMRYKLRETSVYPKEHIGQNKRENTKKKRKERGIHSLVW